MGRSREAWGRGARRAPQDPRRRGAGASSPRAARAPRRPPPTHPPRCSYVLVVTVAPRLVLEPGPATRAAAAAAALPGPRRGRLGSEGLGSRAVFLGPLAAQEATRLRGRREGPRGVDLAGEPLVQRSHRSPRALAPAFSRAFFSRLFPLGVPLPTRGGGTRGRRRRRGRRKDRGSAAAPPARHSQVAAGRRPGSASSAPSPGGSARPGSGGVFAPSFLFCFATPRRGHARPNHSHRTKGKHNHQNNVKGGKMPRPWNLAPPRDGRASGANLRAPPPRAPRAAAPPPPSPHAAPPPARNGARVAGAGSQEAAGPRSRGAGWDRGRAAGSGVPGPRERRERRPRRGGRWGGGVGGTEGGGGLPPTP